MQSSVQFSPQLCPTLCNSMDCSIPGFPVYHQLPEPTQLMSIVSVMPSNHLNHCRPLLLPPSIFPSIRVFFNESVRHIRWPKHWSFSFSISPPNEYSILIFFRIDWFVQSWEDPDHPTWSSAHAPCSIHQLAGLCLSHSIYHTYRHLLSGLLAILVLSTCCLLDVLWW